MIQTVAEAQRSKAPLQRLADVFAKYFVIVVLLISVLTFVAWMVFGGAQFDLALMCAVAVLIIACPCAGFGDANVSDGHHRSCGTKRGTV
jgi:Cu+-exporting ATPase